MPPGVSDRDFASFGVVNNEQLSYFNKTVGGAEFDALAKRAVPSDSSGTLVRGKALNFGFRIEEGSAATGCSAITFFEHIHPCGNVLPRLVNLDRVGTKRAQGIRGMVKKLVELQDENGLEAWRQLALRFDPVGESYVFDQMSALMDVPRCKQIVDIPAAITRWRSA
jgi:hypothetical protein